MKLKNDHIKKFTKVKYTVYDRYNITHYFTHHSSPILSHFLQTIDIASYVLQTQILRESTFQLSKLNSNGYFTAFFLNLISKQGLRKTKKRLF